MGWLGELWNRFLGESVVNEQRNFDEGDFREIIRKPNELDYGLFDGESDLFREISERGVDESVLDWLDENDFGSLRR